MAIKSFSKNFIEQHQRLCMILTEQCINDLEIVIIIENMQIVQC